jgi:glycosyltransferase involved in cell wall biosynthesis
MQKFWIGMVSELHPTKRIADAIEAFSQVAEMNPAAILVILGEGEERERLESLIRARHLESCVFLLGFIPDARTYLKAFDLFLHTSRSEALAYAILEAGCAALPTIATKVGGIPEIITTKEHGLLVPREQPHDIAAALTTLLSDPETSTAYGRALHVRVTERFSQAQMVERTLRTYDA